MTKSRLRSILEIVLIVVVFVAVNWFLIGMATAAENVTNTTNTTDSLESISDAIAAFLGFNNRAPTPEEPIPYIYQGDVVYLETTVDISGVIPPYPEIAYWDGYDMYDTLPTYVIEMGYSKKDYYKFYIDPSIFATRTGKWYKYSNHTGFERQGYNLAFIVSPYYFHNYTLVFPNGTAIDFSEKITPVYEEHPKIIQEPLPGEPRADYVLAKGDPFDWPDGNYRLWLFGNNEGVYFHNGGFLSVDEINALPSGRYTVGIHTAGPNTIYEAEYRNDTLFPGLFGKEPVDVRALNKSSSLMRDRVKEMIADTDDKLDEYNMDLDLPFITIRQADEVVKSRGVSYLDVRGYTNAANGTVITVTLDEKDQREYEGKGEAIRTSPGNLSSYSVLVPVVYDELAADARNHTLIARTAIGGQMEKDFKISTMPADSFRPNASLKYIEDRNPFIPTPTPLVVTQVVTETVPVYITVEVTPPPSMVYEQQKKAADAKWNEFFLLLGNGVLMVVVGVVFFGVGYYAFSLYSRANKKKKVLEELRRKYQ